jgi:predicted Zn-dependent protease
MKQHKRRLSSLLALSVLLLSSAPLPVRADQEQQIGQQVYTELNRKGEIISSSPLYATLEPIAARIKRIADPQYQYPFHFILVHEKDPNAFAVPGGNVYVTDSLMSFVQNKEELAGVLCHETSHDIHHDVINNMRKDQNLQIGATILSLLLGRAAGGLAGSAINLLANVQAQSYSRAVETAADAKGSDTCAEAGFNPWGMVWLFQKFSKQDAGTFEMLSDHPRDDHRIADLENHFRAYPTRFARFSSNIAVAAPLPHVAITTPAHAPTLQPTSAAGGPPHADI